MKVVYHTMDDSSRYPSISGGNIEGRPPYYGGDVEVGVDSSTYPPISGGNSFGFSRVG